MTRTSSSLVGLVIQNWVIALGFPARSVPNTTCQTRIGNTANAQSHARLEVGEGERTLRNAMDASSARDASPARAEKRDRSPDSEMESSSRRARLPSFVELATRSAVSALALSSVPESAEARDVHCAHLARSLFLLREGASVRSQALEIASTEGLMPALVGAMQSDNNNLGVAALELVSELLSADEELTSLAGEDDRCAPTLVALLRHPHVPRARLAARILAQLEPWSDFPHAFWGMGDTLPALVSLLSRGTETDPPPTEVFEALESFCVGDAELFGPQIAQSLPVFRDIVRWRHCPEALRLCTALNSDAVADAGIQFVEEILETLEDSVPVSSPPEDWAGLVEELGHLARQSPLLAGFFQAASTQEDDETSPELHPAVRRLGEIVARRYT